MDISGPAASISAMALANHQAQASLLILRKTLEMQQTAALHLLQALPQATVPNPAATVGGRIDTYA